MSRLINRLCGRVYGWFDSKDARPLSKPLPARFPLRANLALVGLEDRSMPSTFTVLNPGDDTTTPAVSSSDGSNNGTGTLRQAMVNAAANAGPDIIVFSNSTTGGATDFTAGLNFIALRTALPIVTAAGDLTITGPGADKVVVTRNTSLTAFNRPFTFSPTSSVAFNLSGMTLTGFSGTTAGGAIGVTTASTLTLDGMQIVYNTSSVTGGAIDISAATSLTIRNSTLAYNYGSQGGAIEFRTAAGPSFVLENSTIANNTGYNGAGGIQWGTGAASTVTNFTNSTLTGNTTYNTESKDGFGGGALQNHQTAVAMTITLNSTILAGNFASNGRHDASFGTAITVNAQNSLIGVSDTFAWNDVVPGSNKTGTKASPLSPNLSGFLRSSGGTFVLRPNPGSLAIDNGDPLAPLATDQRGLGRSAGSVDIGAVEVQSPATEPATAFTNLATMTTNGAANYEFEVTYQLNGGHIDFDTLDGNDLVMLSPSGAITPAVFVSAAPAADANSITAKYTVAGPGGTWDPTDYGTYTIVLAKDQVKTAAGVSLNPGILGSFNSRVGTVYTVTSTADTATGGTLRQAVTSANNSATQGTIDTIVFDSSFVGSKTISIGTTALSITDGVNIIGPGKGVLTLNRAAPANTNSFFAINQAVGNAVVTISDMTLSGSTVGSPLITTSDEWVTLNNLTITGNTVSTSVNTTGGQIMAGTTTNTGGRLTLNNCAIINSRSTSTATTAGANGGAINIQNGGWLTLNNTTLSGNSANGTLTGVGNGGGVAFTTTSAVTTPANSLVITGSTISGNNANNKTDATAGGGGVSFIGVVGSGGFLIRNSTIVNNSAQQGTTAGGNGGGVLLRDVSGTFFIQNSTISGNTYSSTTNTNGFGGGAVALTSLAAVTGAAATLNIESTILSGNITPLGNGRDDLSVLNGVTLNSSHNAIGDPDGFTLTTSVADLSTADSAIGMLNLAPLALNGGSTQTLALQAGSTAISAGSNPSPVQTLDQNGNPRVIGTAIDIGASEYFSSRPTATAGSLITVNVDDGSTNPYVFTVTYDSTSGSPIKRSTIGDALEVTVTPAGGSPINASFVSANSAVDALSITATYQITPPGGTWDSADNKDYFVGILGGSVTDTSVDGIGVAANASLGSFTVFIQPPTATVGSLPNVDAGNKGTMNPYTFTVTYSAFGLMKRSTIGDAPEVTVTPTGGSAIPATFVMADSAVDAQMIVATYSISAPGGTWNYEDNNTYTVGILGSSVFDTANSSVVANASMGLFLVTFPAPTATVGSLPNVTVDDVTTNPYVFTITYAATDLMNRSTIGDATEVTVTKTGGSPINAVFVMADSAVDAQSIVATYQIAPPGGTWDGADSGTYSVGILGTSVFDNAGTPVVANASLGSFQVAVPATYTVTNTNDDGTGSLRAAIVASNASVGATDTILFDTAGVFATPQTITLLSQITISDGVIINGLNGANGRVTLSGGGTTRAFNIDSPSSTKISVAISNMNLTNTTANGTRGGAIVINNEILSLTDFNISNSTCSTNAGAISATSSTITLTGGVFSNNKAGGAGGFADVGGGGSIVTATDCTFSNNVTTGAGGVFAGGFPTYTFTNCTFSGNSAASTGGVMQFPNGANVNIINSTLSGNTATSGGAINAAAYNATFTLNIRNSTITGNKQTSTTGNGGGIFWSNTGPNSRLTLNSTIIAGNVLTSTSATASPDIRFNTTGAWSTILGDNNLIGVSEASNFTLGGTNPIAPGTKATPTNAFLLPLANNGGLTQTHALTPSLTVDAGNNISPTLGTDQRGGSFLREDNGIADIGAFERIQGIPMAIPGPFTPVTPGSLPNDPYTFTITYANEATFVANTFLGNDILVTGPNGYSQFATYTGDVANANYTNGTDVTYTIPAPVGGWVGVFPNLYTVTLQSGAVTSSNAQSVPAGTLGQIAVQLPTTFAVINTNDSGAGSLRQAILDANALTNTADTIVFALPEFATAKTITLSTEIPITDSLFVDGTGANLLTVQGTTGNRIFNIGNAGSLITVTIEGMKLTGGSVSGAGGAVLASNEIVTLDRVWVTGNTAATGGGVNMNVAGGTLNILNSTLSGNIATTHGGGVYLQCQTTATTLNVINSTISTNSAANLGGGVCLSNSGATTVNNLLNSTFANNQATIGGGFRAATVATPITVASSVFDGNTAGTGPSIAIGTVNSSYSALGADGSYVPASSFADIPNGTPLNLGPLQDNGGTMPTHLPGTGPLLNAGVNTSPPITLDQRGLTREIGVIDIGSVEVQSLVTPTVTGFTVNNGDVQRSRITTITVNFSAAVDAATLQGLGAVTLTRTTATPSGTVGTIVQTGAAGANGRINASPASGMVNSVVLTFDNADSSPATDGVEYGSLADGRWQLAIPSVSGYLSTLDDPTLRRLFGDVDANGTVDGAVDFPAFGAEFNSSIPNSAFDFNNDGIVEGSIDFPAFGSRFNFSL